MTVPWDRKEHSVLVAVGIVTAYLSDKCKPLFVMYVYANWLLCTITNIFQTHNLITVIFDIIRAPLHYVKHSKTNRLILYICDNIHTNVKLIRSRAQQSISCQGDDGRQRIKMYLWFFRPPFLFKICLKLKIENG